MGFFIARYICKNKSIDTTYSIGIGLVFYASLYIYFLFFNSELLPFFTNTLIYVIGIDLLLTTFYSYQDEQINENDRDIFIDNDSENIIYLDSEMSDDCLSEIIELELQEEIDLEPELLPRVKRVKTKVLEILPTIPESEDEEIDTLSKEIENPEALIIEKPKRGRKKKIINQTSPLTSNPESISELSLTSNPESISELSLTSNPESISESPFETKPESISELSLTSNPESISELSLTSNPESISESPLETKPESISELPMS
jgi:hypothetical protein